MQSKMLITDELTWYDDEVMLTLYNSLSKKKEQFEPLRGKDVGLYTCGPTVYNYAHIGNLRTYVFEDILRRVLDYKNYNVKHVMNITDVGHLTDDADAGEDKMEKGARREGKTAWEIAAFYTDAFKINMRDLNILEPHVWCKATDHIPEQIALVQTLIDKGLTYETSDGIYFDTTKIDDYGKLVDLHKQELQAGARVDMGEKKHPHDFALWKWSNANEKRQMEWPFGFAQGKERMGFPGWHIECSAMAIKYLGEQFDIHCGGVDHKPVHHTNEIVQSESATGKKPWVRFWIHGEHLLMGEDKMAKSGENFITLRTLKEKGYSPLAYRYYLLQTHYRKQLAFSWDALDAAEQGLKRLRREVNNIQKDVVGAPHVIEQFEKAIHDDLNMPEALAVVWNGLKDHLVTEEMIVTFDKVLGLDLTIHAEEKIVDVPDKVQQLLVARAAARLEKNWKESDRLRDEIQKLGFSVEDKGERQKVKRT